jgi:maltose alpha-D-glucosyltransferase/alpha-amylase
MHLALADAGREDFAPEPYTTLYQRSEYQSMRSIAGQVFQALRRMQRKRGAGSSEASHDDLEAVLDLEASVFERFRTITGRKLVATRIRCIGRHDLAHVLYTGKDFIITGLEGDQSRAATERRIKRSPLRDVASMLLSFHSATRATLLGLVPGAAVRHTDVGALEPWARAWLAAVGSAFLRSYVATAAGASFVPVAQEDLIVMLDTFVLQYALQEISHDLEREPDCLPIALSGLRDLFEGR